MLQLTENQYYVLDFARDHERVLITGGAGTGKTLVALEAARREARLGRRVLFLVESPVLAAYLQSRAPNGVKVLALEALRAAPEPTDVIVIDEAQDLMTMDHLERVDEATTGALFSGRWRIFYDFNNQAGVRGAFEPAALELLEEMASGQPLVLSRNCRNTSEIVRQTQLTTGADLGVADAGKGPPVHFQRFVDETAMAAALEAHLDRLVDEEFVEPGSITLLAAGQLDDALAPLSRRWRRRLLLLDAGVASDWPPTKVTAGTVSDFKGLENDFIALLGLPPDSLEGHIRTVYVAMSRARAGLWIAVPESLWAELETLQETNLATIIGGNDVAD